MAVREGTFSRLEDAMRTPVFPSLSRLRFKLVRWPSLEIALLITMLVVLQAIEPIREAWVTDVVAQNVADQQLSYFADEIVIQALLCRRFEKDILLNLSDQAVPNDYLSRWNQATADLDRAIDGFRAAAVTGADRMQADEWQAEFNHYRAAFLETLGAVESGSITTPAEANDVLIPAKASIRDLTNTAMTLGSAKDTAAQASSDSLRSTLAGTVRVLVVLVMIALILCTALARR
jgi:hypothetical protein